MISKKLLSTAAVALFAMATASSAATLSGSAGNTDFDLGVGDYFNGSTNLLGGQDVTYTFNVVETLSIDNFATAGTGGSKGADLMNVRFGYGLTGQPGDTGNTYSFVQEFGSVASAIGAVAGQQFDAGESFFFTFINDGNLTDMDPDLVGTTVSFETVAPVPLPAAGFLLLGALGAGAVVGRRKKIA